VAADGRAVVETYTVVHGRDGARIGIVIGRLDADGRRFIARGDDRDLALAELLATAPEPVGERVHVRSSAAGNQVAVAGPGGRS
jgi:acetyl-CoA C-acetyltransferase